MKRVAELGGFCAAHGVWSISDGEVLVPFCIVERADGQRCLTRFAAEQLEEAVIQAGEFLENNPQEGARAALVYDAFVNLEAGKTDALIVTARSYESELSFTMIVPYRPASAKLAVYRPKLSAFAPPDLPAEELAEAFFAGVEAHTEGAAVWNAHQDESR